MIYRIILSAAITVKILLKADAAVFPPASPFIFLAIFYVSSTSFTVHANASQIIYAI